MAADELLAKVTRAEAVEIWPDDVVVLHCNAVLDNEQIRVLADSWHEATGLPNRTVVASGGVRVEIERPTTTTTTTLDDHEFDVRVRRVVLEYERSRATRTMGVV